MRITVEVTDTNPVHSRLSVWVNGALITPPGGICLRNEEVEEFTDRLHGIRLRQEERFAIARRVEDAVYKFLAGKPHLLSERMSHKDLASAAVGEP